MAPVSPRDGQGKAVGSERLNDKEAALLVNRAAMAAGVRGDPSEIDHAFKFSDPGPINIEGAKNGLRSPANFVLSPSSELSVLVCL